MSQGPRYEIHAVALPELGPLWQVTEVHERGCECGCGCNALGAGAGTLSIIRGFFTNPASAEEYVIYKQRWYTKPKPN